MYQVQVSGTKDTIYFSDTYLNFPKNLHSNTSTGDYFPKKVISS